MCQVVGASSLLTESNTLCVIDYCKCLNFSTFFFLFWLFARTTHISYLAFRVVSECIRFWMTWVYTVSGGYMVKKNPNQPARWGFYALNNSLLYLIKQWGMKQTNHYYVSSLIFNERTFNSQRESGKAKSKDHLQRRGDHWTILTYFFINTTLPFHSACI